MAVSLSILFLSKFMKSKPTIFITIIKASVGLYVFLFLCTQFMPLSCPIIAIILGWITLRYYPLPINKILVCLGLLSIAVGWYFGIPGLLISFPGEFSFNAVIYNWPKAVDYHTYILYVFFCVMGGCLISIASPPLSLKDHFLLQQSENNIFQSPFRYRLIIIVKSALTILIYYYFSQYILFSIFIAVSNAALGLYSMKVVRNKIIIYLGLFLVGLSATCGLPLINWTITQSNKFIILTDYSIYKILIILGGTLIAIAGPPFSLKDQFPQREEQEREEHRSLRS